MRQGILLLAFCFLWPAFISGYTFTRTLSAGDGGEDVKELQALLNRDSETQVAFSGLGSPGSETNYFGFLTLKAVIAFQEKYRNEVLLPAGVVKPTGIIGHYSRMKLNNLSSGTAPLASSLPTLPVPNQALLTSSVAVPSLIGQPKIFSLSHYNAAPGAEITVTGEFFDPSQNTVHFSHSDHTADAPSIDGRSLTFKLPSKLPPGAYNLWVSTDQGSSFNESFGNYFSVSLSSKIKETPSITSISPEGDKIGRDDVITIKGSHFEKQNTVISNFGQIKKVPAENGKIEVRLSDFSHSSQLETLSEFVKSSGYSMPLFFYVQTPAGVSEGKSINLEI